MSIPYEKAVTEDLNLGYGAVDVTMPGGGTASGAKVGIHTFLRNVIDAVDAGALGDGIADDRAALNTLANTTLPAAGGTIYFEAGKTYKIASSLTFPSKVMLWFAPGAKLSVSSGATVTVNGYIVAPGHQTIFDGAGTVVTSSGLTPQVSPNWFSSTVLGEWGPLTRVGTFTLSTAGGGSMAANTYYCNVVPVNGRGLEGLFPIDDGVTFEKSIVVGANGKMNLSWNAIPGAASYHVYVGTASGQYKQYYSTATTSIEITTTPKTAPTGLAGSKVAEVTSIKSDDYHFKVTAIDANGETFQGDHNAICVSLTAAEDKAVRIDLSWDAVSGATAYRVYISSSVWGGFRQFIRYIQTASTSLSYTGQAVTAGAIFGNGDYNPSGEFVVGAIRALSEGRSSFGGDIIIAPRKRVEAQIVFERWDLNNQYAGYSIRHRGTVHFEVGQQGMYADGSTFWVSGASGSITGATNATPIVITSVGHGRTSRDAVNISGVGGNTAANAKWTITVLSADTFSLDNSAGNGAYTSGGTWTHDTGDHWCVRSYRTPITDVLALDRTLNRLWTPLETQIGSVLYGGESAGSVLSLRSTRHASPSADYVNVYTGGSERHRFTLHGAAYCLVVGGTAPSNSNSNTSFSAQRSASADLAIGEIYNSATGAANNRSALIFAGKDTSGTARDIYAIIAREVAPGAATTDGQLEFRDSAGDIQVTLKAGFQIGTPTGGDKGAGTINAQGDIYKQNSAYTNPDFVFEQWATGRIEKYSGRDGAKAYQPMTLADVEQFARTHWRLPGISDDPMGMFERGDKALELIERVYLYLFDHEARLRAMEKAAA